jgi:hypothetical protein
MVADAGLVLAGLGGDRLEGEAGEALFVEQALAGFEDAGRRGRQVGRRVDTGGGPTADLPATRRLRLAWQSDPPRFGTAVYPRSRRSPLNRRHPKRRHPKGRVRSAAIRTAATA